MEYVIFLIIFIAIVYLISLIVRKFEFIIVNGESMLPTFIDGQVILLYKTSKIEAGDIVVATDHSVCDKTMVKRVLCIRYIGEEKRYWLEGDNKNNSYDSRNYGYLKADAIEGKIIKWKKNN